MRADGEDKIIGIELLRFVSAVSVLLWHFQHFGFASGGLAIDREEQPFYKFLFPFYEHGASGVQVFWAISGFIFFYKYHWAVSENMISAKNFFVNRLSRLYPLHAVTLLSVLFLQIIYLNFYGNYFIYQFNDIKHFILNAFFVSGWGWQDGDSFNAPIWSVSVELIVYIVFFVLVSKLKLIPSYLCAGALVLFFWLTGPGVVGTCLAYFFAGGGLAILKFHPDRVPIPTTLRGSAFHFAGATLIISMTPAVLAAMERPASTHAALLASLILTLAALYLVVALNRWFLASSGLWSFLGNLTYASYLTHFPIQLLIVLILPWLGLAIDARSTWLFVLFFSMTLVVSALVYRYVEMPAQSAIRTRFRSSTRVGFRAMGNR
jgi:peptidoglycan/LPS O-acetylase OafA/YrhL